MNALQAALVIEMLTNAGWVDDADELIGDMLDNNVPEADIRAKCQLIDDTVKEANALVGWDERIKVNAVETLDQMI